MRKYDLVVIGGGVAGSFTGLLASLYGLNTCIVEASGSPDGATSLSGGVVTRMMDNKLDRELAYESLKLIYKFIDVECIHKGYLCIESYDYAVEDLEKYRQYISDIVLLDEGDIKNKWGYIRIYDEEVGLYSPTDVTVDPYKLLRFLWGKVVDAGCELRLGKRVSSFLLKDNRVVGLRLSDGNVIKGRYYVLCAGTWNKVLLKELGVKLDVWLLGVPIFKFKVKWDADLIGVWDEYIYAYWRPQNGHVVGGVYDAFSIKHPSEGFRRPTKDHIDNAVDGFQYRFNFSEWRLAEGWCGPISISKNYSPINDLVYGFRNLYLIDGLGGRGLMRGPALAYRLVRRITSRFP